MIYFMHKIQTCVRIPGVTRAFFAEQSVAASRHSGGFGVEICDCDLLSTCASIWMPGLGEDSGNN